MVTAITRQFPLDFPFFYGCPQASARFRFALEDFRVEEILGFSFSGEGEHLCLHVEKRGDNTRWIARLLAEYFEVDEVAIGYCGLKDRRAVTRQWFSVHLPGSQDVKIPDVSVFNASGFEVLAVSRHHKKLRRGMHQANDFEIRLRQVKGDCDLVEGRLQQILQLGVPNYFGEQRFGIDGGNLMEADTLLKSQYGADRKRDLGRRKGRGKRGSPRGGLYLSAARSYLFNLVLAEHIRRNTGAEDLGVAADEGVATGPLWGRGRTSVSEAVRELEQSVLSDWQEWTNALEFSGLQQERRPLMLHPEGLRWHWVSSNPDVEPDLVLSFSLPSGCFATAVLRELVHLEPYSSETCDPEAIMPAE